MKIVNARRAEILPRTCIVLKRPNYTIQNMHKSSVLLWSRVNRSANFQSLQAAGSDIYNQYPLEVALCQT